MNATQLLTHFDRLAEAPDAVPRLRRFIMDLAVRGKLVEQDAGDESAAKLLQKIRFQQPRLSKEKKLKESDVVDVGLIHRPPFVAPRNWVWCRLGDIGEWGSGSTPPRGNSEYYDGDMTWLKSGELGDSLALAGSEERITALALEKCSFRMNNAGDVLIAMYGATIGKLAILAEPAVTNQAVCGCTPFAGVSSRYLFLFLQSRRADFHQQSEGGAQPNISKVKIVTSAFVLPPLAEQHRIVAKVDELMALCDQLEAAQQERERRRDRLAGASLQRLNQPAEANPATDQTEPAEARQQAQREQQKDHARFHLQNLSRLTTRPEHIAAVRRTILDSVVTGRLTISSAGDEPARRLLSLIQNEKQKLVKDGSLKAEKPIQERTRLRSTPILPNSWQLVFLQDVCTSITDGDHLPPPQTAAGVPFLVIGNVRNQIVDFDGCRYVAEDYYDSLADIRKPRKGDVLYTLVGSYGIPVIVGSDTKFCVQRHIGILRPSEHMNVEFLARVLKSGYVFNQATDCATGIAQKTVPLSGLRAIQVPLPPLAEQHRIVAKVDELMALCDQLEAQLTRSQTDSRRLLEAVLDAALAPA